MLAQESTSKYVNKYSQETSDGELARAALQGNEQAFESLVHRYSLHLFNFIFHLLGDYDQACDVLQQVLLQFYLSLSSLEQDRPLKSWLFQVARNRCIDELRRKRVVYLSELEAVGDTEESIVATIADTDPLPEEQLEIQEDRQYLCQAITALPLKFRAVVSLRYASHLTFAEIGKILQMPEATAKTYFQRSKPLLRKALQEGRLAHLH